MVVRPSVAKEGCVERISGGTTTVLDWIPSGDDSPQGTCGTLCYRSNPKLSDRFTEGDSHTTFLGVDQDLLWSYTP